MVGELYNLFSLPVLTERYEIMEHFFYMARHTDTEFNKKNTTYQKTQIAS
jgi:hypothetical protein